MVCRPTAASRFQISGTSSIWIQWYWTFSRSEMSAVSRANSVEISPSVRSAAVGQGAAVAAHPHHEVLGLEDVDVLVAGPGAVVALLTLGVEAPPAHPAAQVLLVDAVEALLGVDVLDAGAHVERVVVLLELLVGVERLAIAERPLAFALAFRRRGLAGCVAVVMWCGSFVEPAFGRAVHRWLSGGADPAAS